MPSIARLITKFTQKEVDYFFAHARNVFKNSSCLILFSPRQKDFARILIITPRKIGNAPERNTLRRRIKAIFYQEKLFEKPFDCAIILHKKAVELTFEQLKSRLCGVYVQESTSN